MIQVMLAVLLSAFVCPGAGQIYNRQFQKGFVLIGLTFLLFLGAGLELAKLLPPDLKAAGLDSERLDSIVQNPSGTLVAFNLLLTVTWVYGMIDAFLDARKRAGPSDPDTPASG